jgi:hypothetical protein
VSTSGSTEGAHPTTETDQPSYCRSLSKFSAVLLTSVALAALGLTDVATAGPHGWWGVDIRVVVAPRAAISVAAILAGSILAEVIQGDSISSEVIQADSISAAAIRAAFMSAAVIRVDSMALHHMVVMQFTPGMLSRSMRLTA